VPEKQEPEEETPIPIASVVSTNSKAKNKPPLTRRPSIAANKTAKPADTSKAVVKRRPSVSAPAPVVKSRVGTARKSFVPPAVTGLRVVKRSESAAAPKNQITKGAIDKRTSTGSAAAATARRTSVIPPTPALAATHQRMTSSGGVTRRTSVAPPPTHQRTVSAAGEVRRASIAPVPSAGVATTTRRTSTIPSTTAASKPAVAPLKVKKPISTAGSTLPAKETGHLGLKQGTAVFSRPSTKSHEAIPRPTSIGGAVESKEAKVAVKPAVTSRLAKGPAGLGVAPRPSASGIARTVSASSTFGRPASGSGAAAAPAKVPAAAAATTRVGLKKMSSMPRVGAGVKTKTAALAAKPVAKI
jgi:hypothetical protein